MEGSECGAGPADGVTNHTFVRLGGQPQHLRTISAGDAWECAPPPSWGDRSPPRGPRPGVAIVVVHSVFRVRAAVWVRVAWYKDSGAVQPTTTCPIYQGWNSKRATLVPSECLVRRAHLVQLGTCLLLNKYFIK